MRLRTVLVTLFVGTGFAAAEPASPPDPEPEPAPDLAPAEAPPEPAPPAPVETPPLDSIPPITINITNNNTGNNSNTNTQTTTAPVDVTTSTPVTATTSVVPIAPPGVIEPTRGRHPTIDRIHIVAPTRERGKWLAVGVTGGEDGQGVRASLDLFRRGPFTLGLAANATGSRHRGHHRSGSGDGDDGSASAVAYLAYTRKIGRLQLRAQIGLGFSKDRDDERGDREAHDGTVARTVGGDDSSDSEDRRHGCSPRTEAALLVALPLRRRLGLVAGPILSATRDRDDALDDSDRGEGGRHERPDVDARFMAGLRFGF